MDNRRLHRGMTLIELLIVVVVISVLLSIAVPSYRQYVLRSHRVEAKSALLNLAAAQEKFYLQNDTYATNAQLDDAPPDGLGLAATTENGWYTITIADGANATGFSATAEAKGAQEKDDDCATLTINQLGVKDATNSDGEKSTVCWD